MKTYQHLLAAAAALLFATPVAQAADPLGSNLDPAPSVRGAGHHSRGPAKGLQLASGLQTSGPLNGSGPSGVTIPLTDEQWRKMFPRKEPNK